MLKVGSLVDGKYKVLSEIGHGGMSVVWMAINEKANKTWAIKEVRKNGEMNFEAVKQGLIVETEMLKKLRHVNLPSIIDVIEDDKTFLIVMDYIEGRPLSKALDEYGAQPQELVIEWAKQLCDVIGYLHTRKPPIIYRDLKPSNIMLKPDGKLTLIDFGTAREFKEKNLQDTTCLGTIGYAAPEQFGGMGQTDARTDIYCLGATLYHLVTGCNPSEPPYEIRPIRQINPSLSVGLEKIINKCVQRNPEDRYQSCAELMYALEHFEEIDDKFKNKQKRKLALFAVTAFLCVGCTFGGMFSGYKASAMAASTYDNIIKEAKITSDATAAETLYKKAIEIPGKSGDKEAYLDIVKLYKENDSVFTVEEQNELVKLIKNNEAELKKDNSSYSEICFEIGKLYWYYYDYGDKKDNNITKMKSSVDWFEEVINNAPSNYKNLGMAKAYSSIGKFYRDISINTVEASDKGLYKPFFENLVKLTESVAEDKDESEIVRLEIYELGRNSIQQYATKFKSDGVEEKDIESLLDKIKSNISTLNATTDKTKEMKQSTTNLIDDTYKAVSAAFGTEKG